MISKLFAGGLNYRYIADSESRAIFDMHTDFQHISKQQGDVTRQGRRYTPAGPCGYLHCGIPGLECI